MKAQSGKPPLSVEDQLKLLKSRGMRIAFSNVLLLLFLTAVAGPLAGAAQVTDVRVVDGPRTDFRRGVIGVNHLAYGRNGLGYGMILKGTHDLDPELVRWQKEIGFGSLRYPGGCGGTHRFEWKRNAGLAGPYYVMGVVEFLAMCESCGAQPIMGVSAHRGTPEEAAEYVEFLNAPADDAHPWARKRAARGHAAPYGVEWFEYGNETYHGMTCSTYRKNPALEVRPITPEGYAESYLAFRTAMRAVDPNVKLGVPLLGSGSNWDRVVTARLGAVADFFVIHTYAQAPERDAKDYLALFDGRANYIRRRLAETKRQVGPQAKFALTEFNVRQGQHKTLTAALVNLETLMAFAEEPRIVHADFWQFVNEGFGMVRGERGAFVRRPNAWAFQLYSNHTLDRLVPSAVEDGHPPAGTDPDYPADWAGRNAMEGVAFRYVKGDPASTATRYERLPDGMHRVTFLDEREENFYHIAAGMKGLPTGDRCVWKVSCEMWTEGEPFDANLDIVDGRGWDRTKSAAHGDSVRGIDPVRIDFSYEPLRDNPGSLLLRFRGRGHKGSAVCVRNLRVEAVPKVRPDIPAVRAQLSVARDGRSAAGVFLNRSFEPQEVRLDLKGLADVPLAAVRGEALTGPSPYATNEETADAVTLKPFAAALRGETVFFTMPPHSAVGLQFKGMVEK